MDDSEETSKKRRRIEFWLLIVLAFFTIASVATAVAVTVVLLRRPTRMPVTSASTVVTMETKTSVATTKITPTTTAMRPTSIEIQTAAESAEFQKQTKSEEMHVETTSAEIITVTASVQIQTATSFAEIRTPTTSAEIQVETTSVEIITVTASVQIQTATSSAEIQTPTTSAEIQVETTSEEIATENTSVEIQTQTATITQTNTVNCVHLFAQSPSGHCVNILIDFYNCGLIGNVCPANYTSCSAGLCGTAPDVLLTNAIPIFTAALNGSVDDTFYRVNLPFRITLYNTTTDSVQVTTNGVLCLENCTSTYTETALPTYAFSGATALAYWDDLFIYANTSQGIYYQSEGHAPNRTLIFEYYCSHYQQPSEYYHFQVVFFESLSGVVQYIYYDVSDRGANCTVGVQKSSSGPFMQHSFHQRNSVTQNMVLTFDTNAGTYTNSSIEQTTMTTEHF